MSTRLKCDKSCGASSLPACHIKGNTFCMGPAAPPRHTTSDHMLTIAFIGDQHAAHGWVRPGLTEPPSGEPQGHIHIVCFASLHGTPSLDQFQNEYP